MEELKKSSLISHACKRSGISRDTIYRWAHKDPQFKKLLEEARAMGKEVFCDAAKQVLLEGIRDGDFKSAKYYLEHNDPTYMPKTFHDRHKEEMRSIVGGAAYRILDMMGALDLWRKMTGNKPFPSEEELKNFRAQEDPSDSDISLEDQ